MDVNRLPGGWLGTGCWAMALPIRLLLLLAGRIRSEKRRSEGKYGPTKVAGQISIETSTSGC